MDSLKDCYENAEVLSDGVEFTYRGYTLRKVGGGGSSELMILNRDGTKVESYTAGAFDSFSEFQNSLDKVIDYDPDDLESWLNRHEE